MHCPGIFKWFSCVNTCLSFKDRFVYKRTVLDKTVKL